MDAKSATRVLSVQSHVVHGYVGNKCAVFVLQRLGLDVDAVNTVHLSNHTGYPSFTGPKMQGEDVAELFTGMRKNGLLGYSHVLTGYIGNPGILKTVVEIVKEEKMKNKKVSYLCDPVMGDNGILYVPQELTRIYRDDVVEVADILTPNQTELELLTNMKISSEEDALAACNILHARGPHTVVVTSMDSGSDSSLSLIASTTKPQAVGHPAKLRITVDKLPGYYSGTGDTLASLLLYRLSETSNKLDKALEACLGSIHGILRQTYEHDMAACVGGSSAECCKGRELQLIKAQNFLLNPVDGFKAISLE